MSSYDDFKPTKEIISFHLLLRKSLSTNEYDMFRSSPSGSTWELLVEQQSEDEILLSVRYTGRQKVKMSVEFNVVVKSRGFIPILIYSDVEKIKDFGIVEKEYQKSIKMTSFAGNGRIALQVDVTVTYDGLYLVRQKMLDLLFNKKYCDFWITVEGTKVLVHKCILGSSSPVFEEILNCPEADTKGMEINEFDLETVTAMLEFLYAGTVTDPTESLLYNLLKASDKYTLVDLKEWCRCFLIQRMSESNVIEFLLAAYDFNNVKLKEDCLDFIADNKDKVVFNEEIKLKLELRKDLAIELLSRTWRHS